MTPTSDPPPPGETEADITEKLRRAAPFMRATGNAGIVGQHANTCEEAAAEIESLRLQKHGLEAMLCDGQDEIKELTSIIEQGSELHLAMSSRAKDLEAALRSLVNHHKAMVGPRAHRLGCQCGGGNDGVHFCSTLEEAFAQAAALVPPNT